MNLNEWRDKIHKLALEKGWWDDERKGPECIALMHSELSEALEGMRTNNWDGEHGVYEEMVDCIIRILDYLGAKEVDVENVINTKHEYNKTRPHKHGKKF